MSSRQPESLTKGWTSAFRYPFGILAGGGAILSWILLVYWLNIPAVGGLGLRSSEGVTVEYFNWHIFCMGTAFLLLMPSAIISFEMFPFLRNSNKNIHSTVNTLALLAGIAGLVIILDCHNILSDTGSFQTIHGIAGLFTLVLFLLNWVAAFLMYVMKWGGSLRGTLKPLHKRAGLVVTILGLCTVCIGLMEKEAKGSYVVYIQETMHAIVGVIFAALIGIIFSVTKYEDKKDVAHHYEPIDNVEVEAQTHHQL